MTMVPNTAPLHGRDPARKVPAEIPEVWLKRIDRAREWMMRNAVVRTAKLKDCAEYVGISYFLLSRKFAEYCGMTLLQEKHYWQITRAKLRMEDGCPLVWVAQDAGFATQPHFNAVFKQVAQMTPLQYIAWWRAKTHISDEAWRKRKAEKAWLKKQMKIKKPEQS